MPISLSDELAGAGVAVGHAGIGTRGGARQPGTSQLPRPRPARAATPPHSRHGRNGFAVLRFAAAGGAAVAGRAAGPTGQAAKGVALTDGDPDERPTPSR